MNRIVRMLSKQTLVHPDTIRRLLDYVTEDTNSKDDDVRYAALGVIERLEKLRELEEKDKEEILAICGYYLLIVSLEKLELIKEKRELERKLNRILGVSDGCEDVI